MRLRILLVCAVLSLPVAACGGEGGGKEQPETYVTSGTSALKMPYIFSNNMVLQQNATVNIWGWANSGVKVSVAPSWTDKVYETKVPASGKWMLSMRTPAGSDREYTVTVSDSQKGRKIIYSVLIGEVWMCTGQSNMEHPMRGFGTVAAGNFQPVLNAEAELSDAEIPTLRYFKDKYQLTTAPAEDTKESSWSKSTETNAAEFEAIAFFFGRYIQRKYKIPVGIIGCAYGGTRIESWMAPESFSKFAKDQYKDAADLGGDPLHKSAPSNIYNGMVLPVINYGIRGWLWYQGESNRDNSGSYAALMSEMVRSWRALKGDTNAELPFYYVQIAPFKSSDELSGAELRDAQMAALADIPNSGIVCAGDVGSQATIHYPNKRVPAERLAMWADYYQYGDKSKDPMGPVFKSMKREGSAMIVTLSNASGLRSSQSNVPYASIAGSDGVWRSADVSIQSDGTLRFESTLVSEPVAVRYCYSTWHVATLYNGAGLPVFPFSASL